MDVVVVGAGVVGLAVARAAARAGRDVLVLEAAESIGTGISSRNSEVVHAGIYYEPGSLKAVLCREGREMLYSWCAARDVPHRRLGKLIVAQADEIPALERVFRRGLDNGVELGWLDGDAARAIEPELACAAAIRSPSTGIVDTHALMRSFLADAEAAGATLALRTPVTGRDGALEAGGTRIAARWVVNAAGLGATRLAVALGARDVPEMHLAKGSYFALKGRAPFSRLVYPTPGTAGLGVHLTLDLAGRARFGPDVEWVDREAYDVDPRRGEAFYARIRTYWPGLPDGALVPAYAGVRPKLQGPGDPPRDFLIQGPDAHGVPGLVNLLGIESPGLTASMAIAERVVRTIGGG